MVFNLEEVFNTYIQTYSPYTLTPIIAPYLPVIINLL